MGTKAAAQREEEGDENHRQSHDREADVGYQQWKVEVTDRALALKAHIAMKGMIGDIGYEEKSRNDKGREHRRAMLSDSLGADEQEPGNERDSGQSIEQGVERRKKKQVSASRIGRRMIID